MKHRGMLHGGPVEAAGQVGRPMAGMEVQDGNDWDALRLNDRGQRPVPAVRAQDASLRTIPG